MSLKLHIVKGNEPGQVILIPDDSALVIGRKNSDVNLDDKMLSRQHMRVEVRGGRASVTDLNSSNGTYLNGDKIRESPLSDGDKIKIGVHIFHVEMSPSMAGAVGSRAAAASGLDALAAAAPRSRRVVFCTQCWRAIPVEDASQEPGGPRCRDCIEGARFDESMIEGFKLIEKVADGRLGPVFKARHLALMKYVCVKIVRSDQAIDEQKLRRFAREAKIGGRLHHPGIVALYDAAQSNGHYYVTLEYVDGPTLEQRFLRETSGRVEAKEVIRVGARIADALAYAWDSFKIIHRNVKPSNIFLARNGDVKLGDFGLAKSLDPGETLMAATAANEPWGTLHYMAPEQLQDSRSVDQRADVYGLGAALFHAVTGARPFQDATVAATIDHIQAGRIDTADRVAGKACPRGLSALLSRAMDRDPARRFQRAAEMRDAFEALGG